MPLPSTLHRIDGTATIGTLDIDAHAQVPARASGGNAPMGAQHALFDFREFRGMLAHPLEAFSNHDRLPPIIRRVLAVNIEQSLRYVAADAARRRHWQKHPTGFAVLKCMDGRVHWATMTGTAMGIVKPMRAMGGRFELGWPAFAKRLTNWARSIRDRGEQCGIFVTYHHSASDAHLGCAGWKHDTAAARAHAERLARDIADVFGDQMLPIVTGVETDRDILTLHGPAGDVRGDALIGATHGDVYDVLARAFPAIPRRVADDLVPFLTGNAARIAALTAQPRRIEALRHCERVIAVGHGFDYWISEANLAVIVNDVDPNLDVPIATAASIIVGNLTRVAANEEVLLLASVPFDAYGMEWNLAVKRAQWLCRYALECIGSSHSALIGERRLRTLIGVTNEQTKRLEPIAFA